VDGEEVEEEDEAVDAAGVAVDVEDMTWDPHHQVRVSMIRARCIIFLKLFYYLSSLSDLFFCCCYIFFIYVPLLQWFHWVSFSMRVKTK
jgi:hypothetical protein